MMGKAREQVKEQLHCYIPHSDATYKAAIKWVNLEKTIGVLPDDIFCGIEYEERDETHEGLGIRYLPYAVVSRYRQENDEEYSQRMKREAYHEKDLAEREYNEYLRLKAKYETVSEEPLTQPQN